MIPWTQAQHKRPLWGGRWPQEGYFKGWKGFYLCNSSYPHSMRKLHNRVENPLSCEKVSWFLVPGSPLQAPRQGQQAHQGAHRVRELLQYSMCRQSSPAWTPSLGHSLMPSGLQTCAGHDQICLRGRSMQLVRHGDADQLENRIKLITNHY